MAFYLKAQGIVGFYCIGSILARTVDMARAFTCIRSWANSIKNKLFDFFSSFKLDQSTLVMCTKSPSSLIALLGL